MTLTKPILLSIPAFDGNNIQTFKFNVVGGDRVVKNKLVIRDNDTNTTVFEQIQTTFKYENIYNPVSIPSPYVKLTNGKNYNAYVITYDKDDNQSQPSNTIQFWCYTQPRFEFTNIPSSYIIPNASFNFEFKYIQDEKEPLNYYVLNLYNLENRLLSSSGDIYVKEPQDTYNYLFAGFENGGTYFIEILGETINNTIFVTERIKLTVKYIKPDIFTLVELFNNCEKGYISVKSNIIAIEGKSQPSPPKYIDVGADDKEVDLTAQDSYVKWDEGYFISDDFLARIWMRKPNINTEILRFSNTSGQTISCYIREGYKDNSSSAMQVYIELIVNSLQGLPYNIISNYIDKLLETEYYNIWITRENNIYELKLAKV